MIEVKKYNKEKYTTSKDMAKYSKDDKPYWSRYLKLLDSRAKYEKKVPTFYLKISSKGVLMQKRKGDRSKGCEYSWGFIFKNPIRRIKEIINVAKFEGIYYD